MIWLKFFSTSLILKDWEYSLGYINEEMFVQHLPKPNPDCLIMFYGPRGMNSAANTILEKLKYPSEMVFRYWLE